MMYASGETPGNMSTYDTFEEAADEIGEWLLDGERFEAIFDLDTCERIDVQFTSPKVTRSEDQGVMQNPLIPDEAS